MKKIFIMVMAFMMIAGQASAFGLGFGLGTLLSVGMAGSAVYSAGSGAKFRADNLWYDPKVDFTKFNSIVVFPVIAQDQDDTSKQMIMFSSQGQIARKLKDFNPLFVVDYKSANDRMVQMAKNSGSQSNLFTENEQAENERRQKEYEEAANPVNYPALLDPFESEAERGAAVRAETGADAYLTWQLSQVCDPDEYKMPKKVSNDYWMQYSYAFCTYVLHRTDGSEILSYSAIVPVPITNGAVSIPDVDVAVNGLADALKDLRKEKDAKEAVGGKTLRIGNFNVACSDDEVGDITRRSLDTAVRQQAEEANLFRLVTEAESDYIVEADFTDCSVHTICEVKKSGMSGFEVKAHVAATVRLVDARSGLTVSTYTGEAEGASESKAFAKVVKKFFEEAKSKLKA